MAQTAQWSTCLACTQPWAWSENISLIKTKNAREKLVVMKSVCVCVCVDRSLKLSHTCTYMYLLEHIHPHIHTHKKKQLLKKGT